MTLLESIGVLLLAEARRSTLFGFEPESLQAQSTSIFAIHEIFK